MRHPLRHLAFFSGKYPGLKEEFENITWIKENRNLTYSYNGISTIAKYAPPGGFKKIVSAGHILRVIDAPTTYCVNEYHFTSILLLEREIVYSYLEKKIDWCRVGSLLDRLLTNININNEKV